jgi:putative ABC transport system permease protein
LLRSLRRRSYALASGAIAISLAVAFGASLTIFVATYQTAKTAEARFVVGSDLRVTASALSAQPTSFASSLQVPGVAAVTPVSQTSKAVVGTDKRALVAVDVPSFQRAAALSDSFFIGSSATAAMSALLADPAAILVSDELARTFNVQPGDPVKIQLPDPTGRLVPVTFHAAGRFKNFPGFPQGIDLVANLAFYQTVTGSRTADFFLARATDPSGPAVSQVAAALQAGPGRTIPLLVATTATAINTDQSTLAALNLRGLSSLESLYTVLLSGAGISIFIFGLILQRRKEYVTMRALGVRMNQLRTLLLGEAGLVAAVSLVIGGLVGTAMAYMYVQILRPLFTLPPQSLSVPGQQVAVLVVAVLGVSALCALLAASYVRRLSLVELLREE